MSDFIVRIARRYPAAIGVEIWNEPNLSKFWGGPPDPVSYGRMFEQIAPAIRAAVPTMPVITAGLAPHGGIDSAGQDPEAFLRAAYTTGGPQLADAIGAHPYPFRPYGDDFLGAIRTELFGYRQVMAEFGEESEPIWVTETGVANHHGYSLEQQADALSRIYILFRRIANIPVLVFHRFVDVPVDGPEEATFGVLDPAGEPKPAYCAVAGARDAPC